MIPRREIVATLVAVAALACAAPAAAATPAGFLGMSAPRATPADFTAMAAGGVGTYRLLASWGAVQGTPGGAYDWRDVDRDVSAAAANGIQPLVTLYGSARFVSRDPRVAPIGTSAAQRGWKSFVAAAVARYGPGGELWSAHPELPYTPVRAWETWQEQNNSFFWRGRDPSPKRYAKLLRLTDAAVSEADPGAEVLVGGMHRKPLARGSIRGKTFLSRLYRTGVASRFDGVAAHPYDGRVSGVIRQVRGIRTVMDGAGDRAKPIWVTELGWSTKGPPGWALVTSKGGQARKLDSSLRKLIARRHRYRLRAVVWFSWRDHRDRQCRWCGGSGLLTRSGKPKPAWSRFARLAAN